MIPRVQKSKGWYFVTIPVYIAEAMNIKKGDKVVWRFNGHAWELRKD